jgi:hypothetical protein
MDRWSGVRCVPTGPSCISGSRDGLGVAEGKVMCLRGVSAVSQYVTDRAAMTELHAELKRREQLADCSTSRGDSLCCGHPELLLYVFW